MFAAALNFTIVPRLVGTDIVVRIWGLLKPTQLSKFKAAGFFRHWCEHLRQVVRVLAIVAVIVVRNNDTVLQFLNFRKVLNIF